MDETKKKAKDEFEDKILKVLREKGGYMNDESWRIEAISCIVGVGFTEKEISYIEDKIVLAYCKENPLSN